MTENVHRVILTAADKTRAAFSSFRKSIKEATDSTNSLHSASSTLRSGLGTLGIGLSTGAIFTKVISETSQFETALIGVAKTTGLTGSDLDDFADRIDGISREIPVTTAELLELSQAAGQMGVTGADNLEKFAVTVAKLGRASDLSGEEAATALARILNVTKESVDSVDTLASVIVSLGAKVAASESQITRMTTEVARATSQFDVSSAEAAAMSAAMASIGIQAELGGSAVGRTMQEITSRVQAGGKELQEFADVLNLNSQTLVDLFAENKTEAFLFLLREIGELGLDAGNALEEVGLGGQEIAKTIIPFANNVERLEETLSLANEEVKEATALDREFEAALKSLGSEWQITKNITESYARSLGNILIPSLNAGLKAVNNFFSGVSQVSAAEKQINLIAELENKLKSFESNAKIAPALVGKTAGGFINSIVGPNKREIDRIQFELETAREGLDRIRGAAAELGEESESLANVIKPLTKPIRDLTEGSKGASGGVDGLTKSLKDQIKAGKQFVASLEKEKAQLGKTAIEIRKMEARSFGLADSKDELIDEIEQERISLKALEDDLRKIESITRSVMTEEEKLAAEQAELNRLMGIEGGLSAETYGRAMTALQDGFEKTRNISKSVFGDIGQFSTQAFRNMQTQLARTISKMEFDLKGFVNIGKRLFGELAAASILRGGASLLSGGTFGSGFAGAFGGGGGGAASGSDALSLATISASLSGGFSNIKSLLNGGGSVFSAGSGGAGTAFIGGPGTALGGAGIGANAGLGLNFATGASVLGGALLTREFNRLIANDNKISGISSKTLNTIINPLSQIPVIGKFLPDIGGILTGVFGREPYKFRQQFLGGNASEAGFQDAFVTDVFRSKGGLFSGNKHRQQDAQNADEILSLFDESTKAFFSSTRALAENLNLDAQALDNLVVNVGIQSQKKKAISQEQISAEIARLSDEIVTGVLPNVAEFTKSGETYSGTLSRINTEFNALTNALSVFDGSAEEARNTILGIGFNERSNIVDQFGGTDALNAQIDFFFNNALSGAEQLKFLSDGLSKNLTDAGFSAGLSKQGFNNLILTMNEVSGIGVEAAAKLLPLGPALYQVRDAADQIVQSQQARNNRLIDLFATPTEKIGILQNDLAEGLSKLGLAADLTFEEVNELARAEYAASDGASELLDGLDALIPTYLQLTSITEDYNKSLQDQRDQASSLSDSLLNTLSDRLFDDLEADRKNAIDTAKSDLDDSFALLRRSITAQKDALKTQFDLDLETVADRIKGVSDSVRDLSRLSDVLRDSTNRFNPISVNEARDQIRSATGSVVSGGSVDVDRVRQAISALENQSTSGFTNSLDFAKEQIKSSALIGKLASVTSGQLTLEERSLAALEAQRDRLTEGFDRQVSALDGILSNAQSQLNALNGIKDGVTTTGNALSIFGEALINSRNVADFVPVARPAELVPSIPEATNQQITDYVAANIDNPFLLYTKALEFGLTTERVTNNTDLFTIEEANKFQSENKLINLDIASELRKGNKDNEADNKAILKILGELKTAIQAGNISADKTAKLLRGAVIGDQPLKTEAAA